MLSDGSASGQVRAKRTAVYLLQPLNAIKKASHTIVILKLEKGSNKFWTIMGESC